MFFDGLSEDEKLILNDLNGPSWSPEKKVKRRKDIQTKVKESKVNTTMVQIEKNNITGI